MPRKPTGPGQPPPRSRVEALARPDKWYLGGLDGVVWAPPSPRCLHRPGFWDSVHLLNYEVGPCFSVALLDVEGAEIQLEADLSRGSSSPSAPRIRTQWRPGTLTIPWRTPGGARAMERRRVLSRGVLESAWTLPSEAAARFLVAFTAQPAGAVADVRPSGGGVEWVRRATDRADRDLAVEMEIHGLRPPVWRRVLRSEGGAFPDWALSPLAEGGIDNLPGPRTGGDTPGPAAEDGIAVPFPADDIGWIWIAAAFPVPSALDGPIALRMSVRPRLSRPVWPQRAGRAARTTWPAFFASFPAFSCGDPHLDRYFDHRIHGLGLNRIEGDWGNIRRTCIAEGPEYFHVPITYSAQCHMMEMRWRAGGREAWGSLLNFLDNQKDDGSLHGRLYPNHLERTDFYHANWGDALLAVHAMHPDPATLARCYEGLSRYARWLNRSRDPEGSGMFTVVNHFETGQEYMSR
ncbi:MAG: hypothetical protein OXL34_01770, partial [Gemmatimonadota bacterium]|nr:hypothetical protein [Gemmatimonadota bacterium]